MASYLQKKPPGIEEAALKPQINSAHADRSFYLPWLPRPVLLLYTGTAVLVKVVFVRGCKGGEEGMLGRVIPKSKIEFYQ